MKAIMLLWLVAGSAALAQPVPQDNITDIARPTTKTTGPGARTSGSVPTAASPAKPNVSGALVQAARVKNPLQLINPLAPMDLGKAEDNVSRDPHTGKAQGIKLFSFKF